MCFEFVDLDQCIMKMYPDDISFGIIFMNQNIIYKKYAIIFIIIIIIITIVL
jgi:uncharacterized membrane protein YfbV (UPF0208 family)